MTEERFWELLAEARDGSDTSAEPRKLTAVLMPLSDAEVSDFGLMFYERVCDLNTWRLWAAGYVIAGGMSDDSFHYFRTWIVGKGKSVFEVAMRDPDELGPFIDDPEVENELLEYVTIDLLKSRGLDIDPRDRTERSADFEEPAGEPFEEEAAGALVPRLAAQFG